VYHIGKAKMIKMIMRDVKQMPTQNAKYGKSYKDVSNEDKVDSPNMAHSSEEWEGLIMQMDQPLRPVGTVM
jgi:hypothetical protein